MADNTLSILKPSVNNLTRADLRPRRRARLRGGGRVGQDERRRSSSPRTRPHLTPLLEEEGLPRGSLWESCAIMQYLCNKHGLDQLLPDRPGRAGDGRQRDVLPDRHPLSAASRAPPTRRSASRSTRARSATSEADDELKAKAQQDAEAALAGAARGLPRVLPRRPAVHRRRLSRRSPTSACAATLEFLRAIDYDFPAWAEEYMAAMESALGDAYSEPAAARARLRRVGARAGPPSQRAQLVELLRRDPHLVGERDRAPAGDDRLDRVEHRRHRLAVRGRRTARRARAAHPRRVSTYSASGVVSRHSAVSGHPIRGRLSRACGPGGHPGRRARAGTRA